MGMGARATYVYCAVQAQRKPDLGRAPSGLPGLGRHPPLASGAENTRLLLDAAFLVGTRGVARFRAATRHVARDLGRDGYGVEVTGPWPPYNFVE